MKVLFLFFTLMLGTTIWAQDDVNCEKFHTGKFKYDDPDNGLIIVKREKDRQVEINADKVEIHSSIKWLSECRYILTHEKVVNAQIPELIGEKVYVTIIENKGDRYICRATNESGFGGELEVLMMK